MGQQWSASLSMLGVLAVGEETRNMQQALPISFLRLVWLTGQAMVIHGLWHILGLADLGVQIWSGKH